MNCPYIFFPEVYFDIILHVYAKLHKRIAERHGGHLALDSGGSANGNLFAEDKL